MKLRDQVQYKLLTIAILIVILSSSAIGLFIRMSPAIDTILRENDFSVVAVEGMLTSLLYSHTGQYHSTAASAFESAYQAALQNVTEPGEAEALERINRFRTGAFAGDQRSLEIVVAELGTLADINRRAMRRGDQAAHRLGAAGAWGVAMLGIFGFGIIVLFMRRIQRQVILPILDIHDTVRGAARGAPGRRAGPAPGAPEEILIVQRNVNALLDAQYQSLPDQEKQDIVDRDELIITLLDKIPGTVVVINKIGEIVYANAKATNQILTEDGGSLKEVLRRHASGCEDKKIESSALLQGETLQLVVLKNPA